MIVVFIVVVVVATVILGYLFGPPEVVGGHTPTCRRLLFWSRSRA